MLNFSTLLLRTYYQAIGWDEMNLYSNITRQSTALLDFPIPQSLTLQLANAPTPIFFTSYALDALPQLNGSISYITTSVPLDEIGPSRNVAFRNVVERFRIYPPPRRPLGKEEVWQGGRRVEGRDYLLYSRLHLPSLHLSGLATTRLSPTLQAYLAFLHQPAPPSPTRPLSTPHSPPHSHQQTSESTQQVSVSAPATPGNVLLSLQHDTGRWSGEYTYSAQDGMFGMRGLYNFGWSDVGSSTLGNSGGNGGMGGSGKIRGDDVGLNGKRIDEEDMMEGGLRGRFSAGGEVYFSAKQRSFGISTGLRFTTIPAVSTPSSPGTPPPSPPTTLTLLYNPLIGFLSSAYSAQVSPTVAVSSRFGVNVYSYESDLSIGGEWWIGRRRGKRDLNHVEPPSVNLDRSRVIGTQSEVATLRPDVIEDLAAEQELDLPMPIMRSVDVPPSPPTPAGHPAPMEDDRDGVLKARISGNWTTAVLYESRIRNCLVSVGVVSDFLNAKPIRSVGVEVQYFS